jgi:hypothetical protein
MNFNPEIIDLVIIPALIGLIKVIAVVRQILESLRDLKRELYKNDVLPDRGGKGERY